MQGRKVFCKTWSTEEDYNLLIKAHRVLPLNTPEPYCLLKNRDGVTIGYFQEFIDGVTLQTAVETGIASPFDSVKELSGIVDQLDKKTGAEHGDVHWNNVLVKTDGTLVLVDFRSGEWTPDSVRLSSLRWSFRGKQSTANLSNCHWL